MWGVSSRLLVNFLCRWMQLAVVVQTVGRCLPLLELQSRCRTTEEENKNNRMNLLESVSVNRK